MKKEVITGIPLSLYSRSVRLRMDFAECVFVATNEPQKGCSIKVMYPKSMMTQLNQPLSRILFPDGRDMKNSVILFLLCDSSLYAFSLERTMKQI